MIVPTTPVGRRLNMESPHSEPVKQPHSESAIQQPNAAKQRLTDPVKPTHAHHEVKPTSPHPTNVRLPVKPRPPEAKTQK